MKYLLLLLCLGSPVFSQSNFELKSDALMCKTVQGFDHNSNTHINYMLQYGPDAGTIMYTKSRGCKVLPKYTSFRVLERDISCNESKCVIIKTELKEIGLISVAYLE